MGRLKDDDMKALAQRWLQTFRDAVEAEDQAWFEPHVAGTDDEVTLEWWRADRNVTVFVRDGEVELLKVWGPNIRTDMEAETTSSPKEVRDVWAWLNGG